MYLEKGKEHSAGGALTVPGTISQDSPLRIPLGENVEHDVLRKTVHVHASDDVI